MRIRWVLFLFTALLLLAWALGSLSRSQAGGSLLVNSYWILYILDSLRILGLGALGLLILLVVLYLRGMSDSLGYGIAKKLKKRKKHRALRIIIIIYAWAFALVYLMTRCNGNVCQASSSSSGQGVEKMIVAGSSNPAVFVPQNALSSFTSLVPWGWFFPVFMGLLLVTTVAVARSLVVAFRESKARAAEEILAVRKEVLAAVEDAIRIVLDSNNVDPRTRIIKCYQRLITTASRFGVGLAPEQTARELEKGIRRRFLLEGPAIGELTFLFEEARYSLHPLSDNDASAAQVHLVEIAQEIHPRLSV